MGIKLYSIERDIYWMQQALALARIAKDRGEVPVGALIVANEKIIAKGYNQVITLQDASCHAEVVAIKTAMAQMHNYRLNGNITLYVTLEPCIMCAGLILHSRIPRVVFGANDYRAGAMGGCNAIHLAFNELPYPTPDVVGGVLAKECQELLTEFFEVRR